jgi:hypothetical protein
MNYSIRISPTVNYATGRLDPSYERIARLANISVRSVARALTKLKGPHCAARYSLQLQCQPQYDFEADGLTTAARQALHSELGTMVSLRRRCACKILSRTWAKKREGSMP